MNSKINLTTPSAIATKNTGSPEAQIEILSTHIKSLTTHLKVHKKDFSAKRGLINMISKRNKMVKFKKQQ